MTLGITHLHGFFGETLNCSSILEALDDMLPRMQPPGAPVFCLCRGVYYVHRKKRPADVKICEVSVVKNLEPVFLGFGAQKVEQRTEVEA